MAALSDQLLVVAILAYLAAMLAHAVDYAFDRPGARGDAGAPGTAPPAAEPAAAALVTAAVGGPVTVAHPVPGGAPAGPPGAPPPPAGGPPAGRAALPGRIAVAVTVVAVLVHLGCLVTRGLAADRMPWGNMYEFVLSVTFVGAVGWLVVRRRWPHLRHVGMYVVLVLMLLLGLAGMVLYTPIAPLAPALNSYWFIVHVWSVVLASGMFLLGFVPAALYLIRAGHDRGRVRFPYPLGRRLPAAETLERLTFRLHAIAFPIWTFGVAAGAIWAEAAWSRYWGWDPKETWSFISWVVYAGYLHARATPSVRRTTVVWIAVLGWATMLMNLIGVNIFFEGLHSYAGLD
ncbi:MAG TPA: c-type cytochrome biogenesis protein CcsB [Pilimelia sp.]|nr:c-type cytochrome biogenesis protein CcsB [Pilimelia sp.]